MCVKILQNDCRLAAVNSSKADKNLRRLFWKVVGHQKARGVFLALARSRIWPEQARYGQWVTDESRLLFYSSYSVAYGVLTGLRDSKADGRRRKKGDQMVSR